MFFHTIAEVSTPLLIGGVIVGVVWHSLMYGPQAAFVSEQFSPRLRYTGCSLAYTLAGVIGGALAPLLFTSLFASFGSWLAPACYLAGTCVLTVIGLAMGRSNAQPEQSGTESGSGDQPASSTC